MSARSIQLRGVEVHNLQQVDLDLPHGQLICFCGVSGSGKSSLALDTLYAEGQRRYIESFSAYTRQFLDRLERPAAELIAGLPPAIAVTRGGTNQSSRSTVGTATETYDYLRLLYAKIGQVICHRCQGKVDRDTAVSVAQTLESLPEGERFLIGFPLPCSPEESFAQLVSVLREQGFVRLLLEGELVDLASLATREDTPPEEIEVVVDRLVTGKGSADRYLDSLEMAFSHGEGRCFLYLDGKANWSPSAQAPAVETTLHGKPWWRMAFQHALICPKCELEYREPEPRLFSFNSPLGACQCCEGFGNTVDVDMELVVPDRTKTLREGAIAPWTTPAYTHELEELLALAEDYDLPVDVPYESLQEKHLRLIEEGVTERDFGGLRGFFAWLERNKYKMHIRVFLSRWRTARPCPDCHGARLRTEALAVQVGDKNLSEVVQWRIDQADTFFESLTLSSWQQQVVGNLLEEVQRRLAYLQSVGLGYLSLDRTLKTLSGGEAQRVALTSALGSNLVNMLYVLDEPSVGLHPRDVEPLSEAVLRLRDRGNTVVMVEHEPSMIQMADQIVEIGPEAGAQGGRVVFQGTPKDLLNNSKTLTSQYLSGERGSIVPPRRRVPEQGWIRLKGARGNNLQDLTIEFPLGCLCLVTGVSGSGKSSLVQDTLYPAIKQRMGKDGPRHLPFDELLGDGQIDDVVLVDQSPIGRSPRSNPVTYIKAFDEIRAVFAETLPARTHNYTATHFSFNAKAGGRCETCNGDGSLQIDMQFLADLYMTCPQCKGQRYRPEILEVTYRNRNIAQVLAMTVRQAFTFFRGQTKVQTRLKRLIDVGLDYVRLGQAANTLSAGEAQRLKLAAYLSATRKGRTLFLLDEPTTGLHFADVVQLLDCFESLLSVGHSLVIVEHNVQMMMAADYMIDLGPGAADQGGQVVASGTPEQVTQNSNSITGAILAEALAAAEHSASTLSKA